MADLVGRVLAGRYRLLGSIGAGAGGRVYAADDVRLRRRVAVKVLHAGLSDDMGFLRRFRTEAQLAASLHHPNVMAVYDWGEDDGIPFMVLELLEGGSLRGHARRRDPAHARRRPRTSGARSPPRSSTRTGAASSTATSSRPTSSSTSTASCASPTSVWPARSPKRAGPSPPAPCSAPRATRRPSRAPRVGSTVAPTSTRSGSCSWSRSPATCRSSPRRRSARSTSARRKRSPRRRSSARSVPVIERAGQVDPDDRYPDAPTMARRARRRRPRAAAAGSVHARRARRDGPRPAPDPGRARTRPKRSSTRTRASTKPVPVADPRRAVDAERPRTDRAVRPRVRSLILAVAGAVFALTRPQTGATVTVPNLQGMTEQSAQTTANRSGCSSASRTAHRGRPAGHGHGPAPRGRLLPRAGAAR